MARGTAKMTLALITALWASGSTAQELNWSWGVDVTSNYVFAGVTQSDDGPAIQPWFEVESQGAYFAFWGSTVDLGPDEWELDYYLGYRNTTSFDLDWDIGLAFYTYNSTGYCCSELTLALSYPLSPKAQVGGFLGYNPESGDWHRYLDGSYAFTDRISGSALIGANDGLDTTYWQLGASYSFNENVSADLRYHGADVGDAGLAFSLSFGF